MFLLFEFQYKAEHDIRILDFAMKKISHNMEIHFIYAGFIYMSEQDDPAHLYSFIFDMMKKYKMKSSMFTMISMFKSHLVTKEVMEDYYKGRFKDENDFDKASVHDDLEIFFEKNKLGNDIELVPPPPLGMYCLPKLTEDELLLINNKDEDYLRTFAYFHVNESPDIEDDEMKLSESKSKFAYCMCFRVSARLTL